MQLNALMKIDHAIQKNCKIIQLAADYQSE